MNQIVHSATHSGSIRASRRLPIIALVALLFAALFWVPAARAESWPVYLVNTQDDGTDWNPGDNVCETAQWNHKCTLRAAIMESNKHAGTEVILLDALEYKIQDLGQDDTGEKGDFDITGEVDIEGEGMDLTTIDAKGGDRIFDVLAGATLTISNLTLRGGISPAGGGLNVGKAAAYLNWTRIQANGATFGGGIAIAPKGYVDMRWSSVEKNSAGAGGGVFNQGALLMLYSTLYDNGADYGGGISNGGSVQAINSTFAENRAVRDGGALLNSNSPDDSVYLSNVTISHNVADFDKADQGDGGGIYNADGAKVTLKSTILAGNLDKSPDGANPNAKPHDCKGVLDSQGNNLLGDNYGCSGLINGKYGDKVGTLATPINPQLGTLGLNGGLTLNYPLLPKSPAIDAGDPDDCSWGTFLWYDQRGFIRHVDGGSGRLRCDMGAFEFNSQYYPCDSQKPLAPPLVSPKNNAQVNGNSLRFEWDPAVCAHWFRLILKRDSKTGPVVFRNKTDSTFYTPGPIAPGHTYFWRVKACGDLGCSKSTWFKFTK